MGFLNISNESEWVEGSVSPILLNGAVGFKKIKVTVIIKGTSRENIWENASNLVASLLNPATIKLDGFSHEYYCYLKNASEAEMSLKRWHKATLELYGYEYAQQVVVTTSSKVTTITNEGNLITPAVVEITPSIGKVDLTLCGLVRNEVSGADEPIIIRGLEKDKTIIIDGESGLVTVNGENKFKDVILKDLPSLLPGNNIVSFDKEDILLTIKYKARFI